MKSRLYVGETKRYRKGDVIAKEGDEGCEAFQILKGRVAVQSSRKVRQVVLTEGDIVGEMALVDQAPRSATLTALDAVEVEIITMADFHSMLNPCHPLVRKVVKGLVKRLRAVEKDSSGT
jgi:CRP-like cAMP-binding protein